VVRDAAPIGVILVNLGTPTAPRPRAVARFLREFLSDRRIVELNPVLWRTLLELCILPLRSRSSATKYASVWTEEGSAILVHSRAQAAALEAALARESEVGGATPDAQSAHPAYTVRCAMRYGSPSIPQALDNLSALGVERILIVPMFPQYSQTTVASIFDAVARHLARRRNHPELRFIRSYATDLGYIEALAALVETSWRENGRPDFSAGERLILSFHSIPRSMADDGDPYHSECLATARALRTRLGLSEDECLVTFQSKFGPGAWLTPATIDTVRALARAGVGRLDVFCPGFTSDCLETLEEIDLLNAEAFAQSGGRQFIRPACLNASEPFIAALTSLVHRHTTPWPPQ
jgi:ferrochelatase